MGSIAFTNAAGPDIKILYLKINDTTLFDESALPEKTRSAKIGDKQSVVLEYNDADWNDYKRMWMKVSVEGKTYSVDLNRDHYFAGGGFHYPGNGSMVNYFFSGFSDDGSKLQFNQCYASVDSYNLTYCSDFKYLD